MKKQFCCVVLCVIFILLSSLICFAVRQTFLCGFSTCAISNQNQNKGQMISTQTGQNKLSISELKNVQNLKLDCLNSAVGWQQSNKQMMCENEKIEFEFGQKSFIYSLKSNIKKSDIFSIDYKLNQYNRFGTKQQRVLLLSHMLSVGIDQQIAVNYIFPNLKNMVDKIAKNIYIKPQNATISTNTNSEKVFYITKEKLGHELNKAELYSKIVKAYLNDLPLVFSLPTNRLNPTVFAENLAKYTHLRGDFSTYIASSSADRKHNIKNALNTLNMREIQAGEVFSFNKTIGRRTEENGYRSAKIIVNNEVVDGLGGGVCQVSSTLYNTALLSGLEIVEANKHSRQVAYVKYGFDAMVNFGSSDLKFENNTGGKIVLVTNFNQNRIRIRIFGEDLGQVKYKLVNEIVSVTEPEQEEKQDTAGEYMDRVIYKDQSFVLKKGTRGMEIKSYREKYVNGLLVNTELLRFDKFKPTNAVVVYGTKDRPLEQILGINLFGW